MAILPAHYAKTPEKQASNQDRHHWQWCLKLEWALANQVNCPWEKNSANQYTLDDKKDSRLRKDFCLDHLIRKMAPVLRPAKP